ncbi:hypothetical protein PRABACTJOHN_02214 [Parabacteroides johnsonii DSM 18315]|uniref:Uncharacterized protein n=1 Tax=Parabacteroides johnsonii DSM 18315 TaxID=537006 RepID=B7BB03_9BACT|nr:hypothetical protein PRABACTJOHN_02214 [Parabacteroides johnsonii DSM 18315]
MPNTISFSFIILYLFRFIAGLFDYSRLYVDKDTKIYAFIIYLCIV